MTWKTFLLSLLALAVATPSVAQEDIMPLTEPVALDPADPKRDRFGELIFRGGIAIEPGAEKIGGISGIDWHEERLYAVTDDGRWLTITPDEPNGRLSDIYSISAGNLLDLRGKRLRKKELADAEAVANAADLGWLIAFEGDHRVWRYGEIDGRPSQFDVDIADLVVPGEANSGIETLSVLADGTLFACGEFVSATTPNCAFLASNGAEPVALTPAVDGVSLVPTDSDCTRDGTCFVLFRSFSPGVGNHIAIMAIERGAEPKVIAQLTPDLSVDNFEGLAVREQYERTYLYIVSDDNFSDRQRTLLMKFEVGTDEPETPPAPPPGTVATTVTSGNFATISVVLETTLGSITLALETERAPITASNFLRYVDEGRFNGTVFYRAMRLDREPLPNGLIQGGTQWDPDRILPGITHEPTTLTGLSHTSGALSMAMGEPGSANGDFSIMIQDQTGLDAQPDSDDPVWKNGYAVFGYVTDGMDVVESIHGSPVDPNKGEGWMRGQLLAEPVTIIDVRRAEPSQPNG